MGALGLSACYSDQIWAGAEALSRSCDQLAMTRRLGEEGGPGSSGSAGAPMRLGWGVGPY
eukprot:SAG22_NODE_19030_length_278_cov_2.106145_1_plen_59_part_10